MARSQVSLLFVSSLYLSQVLDYTHFRVSSAAESFFRPGPPKWLKFKSNCFRWEGLEVRAEAREEQPSSVTPQPDNLQRNTDLTNCC